MERSSGSSRVQPEGSSRVQPAGEELGVVDARAYAAMVATERT
jgi:hypothetical protein